MGASCWQNGQRSIDMKFLSPFRFTVQTCGIISALALLTSCGSSLTPQKAAVRLAQSPVASVFSHNDVHSPKLRDCYEAGPLPDRTRRALITWLHDSSVKEMSYVYPQYYVTTTNAKGGGEVVWAILSDNQGNMTGVLAPQNKRVPAWDLPTVGSYKVFVCDTPDREALSNAIMESLADAGYDHVRIDTRKASGLADKRYLLSKPLNEEEQKQLERERKEKAKALEEAKKKAEADKAKFGTTPAASAASDDSSESSEDSSDSSSDDSDSTDSDDSLSGDSDDSDELGDSDDSGMDEE